MDTEPESVGLLMQFLLIAVLTLFNAFFASAEMAIVSVNKTKIKMLSEKGNRKAQLLEELMKEPTKFLSTIQVGITFAGFFSSAAAATGISDDVGRLISSYGIPYGKEIAIIVVTILLSYITLVFGELYPKRVALQKSEVIAMFAVKPILFVSNLTKPFIKLLSFSTNILIKITGMSIEDLEEKVSKEEIKSLVEVGQEHGVINEIEKAMINGIFEFDDKLAQEVMTPRTQVYLINIQKPLKEYIDELLLKKYSRIPVFEGDSDNIIGILRMKDFMIEARQYGFEDVNIREILKPAYFVPERKNIDILFKELQSENQHMAILIDEYGGFSGIVTIEDLIEEVVGDITDEHEDAPPDIYQLDDNTFMVNGMISIDELNDALDLDLEEDSSDYDTLGGMVVDLIGSIPKTGEDWSVELTSATLTVAEVKDKRVERVKIVKK